LKFFNNKYHKNILEINNTVLDRLIAYEWRGNVRELKNVMERLVISCNNNEINIENLPEELNSFNIINFFDIDKFEFPDRGLPLKEIEEKLNISLIKKAIEKANGNISQAAKLLSMPRETLRDRIRKYKIGCLK
jgi:arginine utilization regulatory protein